MGMREGSVSVRPPAVAGLFYAAEPGRLASDVDGFVADARAAAPRWTGEPRALIVPHAGFVYSGPVAGRAYASLQALRDRIERVVLFGPAHRVWLAGLAGPAATHFETPLGEVPIDAGAVARAAALPQVVVDDRPHEPEHSLEVQLPFLQRLLGHFQLAPFVVGDATHEEVAEVMELLWGGPETLIVVSSDLSHYHDTRNARLLDAATARAIEAFDPRALDAESACGRVPVGGLLLAARAHGLTVQRLDLRNSGDTAGPGDRVVGYGAWVFTDAANPNAQSADDGTDAEPDGWDREALDLARRSVAHAAETGRVLAVDPAGLPQPLRQPAACFVTLRRDGDLRGCIGELEAHRPLAESIAANAHAAALRDPRFPALSAGELAGLAVTVSVLSPLERLHVTSRRELIAALRPGIDGVLMKEDGRRSTLLPAVWAQTPTAAEFVGALEAKGGFSEDWGPEREVWIYRARELG